MASLRFNLFLSRLHNKSLSRLTISYLFNWKSYEQFLSKYMKFFIT
jgi:hypothetical protein